MITIRNLRKVYGKKDQAVVALDDINLDVPRGSIFGVLGQSGAGKSTLIRCVNMLERPTSGSIIVNNQEMTTLSGAALRKARQRIGMIFQHFHLLNSRTVAENVAFPLEVMGVRASERRSRVEELLGLVGLSDKAKVYPSQLSGGQKQRVGIARALAGSPDVLLSDEATSALDPQTTHSILQLLRDLNKRMGLTILLITHQMDVVREICDRVAIIEAGRIVEQGEVSELAAQPDTRLSHALFPRPQIHTPQPGAAVVSIVFAGNSAEEPIISTLARRFEVDVNILSAQLELLGQQRIGQMQAELVGPQVEQALAYLQNLGLHVEVQR
ncbi:D-methionine transport system ATP-binding protein [Thermosporothrix hazakensis]|jgi:D-methionine transport system ATP-binding protein|uniref:D-methionine transport system ATP-binding protein n=1 Tax=Thermosporothrix hazakensis TaxID=644383 RepID=A0A326UC54_THEHA|nr:ATP-binding cassette domain-containing protein [Thermosporothrix hazakensis]PZW36077.1 D-methionine transport system ATP-binding protein [Thermosporothrix hazakensis]GCE46728.1 methionine import ATP-binding protein MetN [Thermosporothrix hazakensis]